MSVGGLQSLPQTTRSICTAARMCSSNFTITSFHWFYPFITDWECCDDDDCWLLFNSINSHESCLVLILTLLLFCIYNCSFWHIGLYLISVKPVVFRRTPLVGVCECRRYITARCGNDSSRPVMMVTTYSCCHRQLWRSICTTSSGVRWLVSYCAGSSLHLLEL